MIQQIKADFYRISKKKSLYYMLGLFTFGFLFMSVNFKDQAQTEFGGFLMMLIQMSPILIGIFVFSTIYNDDLKNKTMQTAIGFGRKRSSIVLTKIIEAALLLFAIYIYTFLHVFTVDFILNFKIPASEYTMIFQAAFTYYLQTLAFFAVTSLVIYTIQSPTLSIVFYLLLAMGILANLFQLALQINTVNQILGFLRPYLIEPVTGDLFNALTSNTGIIKPLSILLGYIAGSIGLSCLLFNKVELEF